MSKIDYTDCNCDDFSSSNYERYYMLSEMINEPVDKEMLYIMTKSDALQNSLLLLICNLWLSHNIFVIQYLLRPLLSFTTISALSNEPFYQQTGNSKQLVRLRYPFCKEVLWLNLHIRKWRLSSLSMVQQK